MKTYRVQYSKGHKDYKDIKADLIWHDGGHLVLQRNVKDEQGATDRINVAIFTPESWINCELQEENK
jgi:hypothetical protein